MSPLYATVWAERFPPVEDVEEEKRRTPFSTELEIEARREVLRRALGGYGFRGRLPRRAA